MRDADVIGDFTIGGRTFVAIYVVHDEAVDGLSL